MLNLRLHLVIRISKHWNVVHQLGYLSSLLVVIVLHCLAQADSLDVNDFRGKKVVIWLVVDMWVLKSVLQLAVQLLYRIIKL